MRWPGFPLTVTDRAGDRLVQETSGGRWFYDRDCAAGAGAEEIQMRRVAGYMFGFMKQQAPKGVPGTPADRSGA